MTGSITFQTDPDVTFVAGLARWIDPPPAPAAPAEEGAEAPAPAPTAFEKECVALEEGLEFQKLYATLRAALAKRLASADAEDAELESAYAIFVQLMAQWEVVGEKVEELADELADPLREGRPELRRSLLLSLYALVQQHGLKELRFPMLLRLIKLCTRTKLLGSLFGGGDALNASVERWAREWELNDEQRKQLWGLILDAGADDARATYECALKYAALHEGSELKAAPEVRGRLVQALLVTIRSAELVRPAPPRPVSRPRPAAPLRIDPPPPPSLLSQFQCDELARLKVVQQLGSDGEFAPLYALLQVFARDTYSGYLKYRGEKAATAFMEKHGLDHEACSTKMRLLSLVSLAQAEKELAYAKIASALQVDQGEVELWCMRAIEAGLMVAKMDQVREVVVVTFCTEREFGDRQWERLHDSLLGWRDSIRGLLTVIEAAAPKPAPA